MTENASADRPTILLAEDDAGVRFLTAEILEEHGYAVVEAENAEEALKLMERRKDVRLLFTDIQMPPGLNGLELAREVHNRWPNVRLLLTSGNIKPARAEIADDGRFLHKPYWAKELLKQLDDIMGKDQGKPILGA